MNSRDEEFESLLAAETADREQAESETTNRQATALDITDQVASELSEFGVWAVNKFQEEGVSPSTKIPRPGFIYRTFPISISRGLLGINGWKLGNVSGLDTSPAFLKQNGSIIRGDPRSLMSGDIKYATKPTIRQHDYSNGLYLDTAGKLRLRWTEGNMAGNEHKDSNVNSLLMSMVVRVISSNR